MTDALPSSFNTLHQVFLSRDSQNNGALTRGIKNLPSSELLNRPVLLVGNHQFFGGDLSLLVREFINQKDTLIRGLAHPMLFTNQLPGKKGSLTYFLFLCPLNCKYPSLPPFLLSLSFLL